MRFKLDWASLIVGSKFTVFALFYFVFEGNFPSTSPGGLYLEGRFNGGFFALPVWGAYIWRGLYMERLIFRNFTVMKESTVNCKVCPMTNLNSVHINVARVLFFFNIRPSN